ncbi:MAG: hypothetical protein JXA49_08165 [Actinobacteria bacterium]|nr:hypothetical protein [Actinomycetota bacterium]
MPEVFEPVAEGKARLDKKTKNLVKRLRPDEIAIIDHRDIDRVSAELLIEKKPAMVVNADNSLTGKYPNFGPLMILAAGIPILDEVGSGIFEKINEGDTVTVEGNDVMVSGNIIASGGILSSLEAELRLAESQKTLGKHLGDFAANTMEYLKEEKEILLENVELPSIKTRFYGKQVLVVTRGHDYKKDLKALRPYIRDMKPVLVAVDGGADALLEQGYKPDLVVGDMDSISDEALAKAGELVVHGYPDGRAPGEKRCRDLDLPGTTFYYPGTSEDIAMLMAHEKGAELIVVVGGHNNIIDFMDKDRKGMASTFLVRLRIGASLVDAKGVNKLYKPKVKAWHLTLMVMAALITMTIIMVFSEPVRQFFTLLAMRLQVWLMRLQNLI